MQAAEAGRSAQKVAPFLRAMIEGSTDLLLVLDGSGGVRDVSPSVVRLLACQRSELLGSSFLQLVHPDDVPIAVALLGGAIDQAGEPVRAEVRARHLEGGWRLFEILARAVPGPENAPLVVVNARDVSEHKPNPTPEPLRLQLLEQLGPSTDVLRRRRSPFDGTPAATLEERPRAQGETVLVVLDQLPVSLLVASLLKELGYAVLEATGPADAEGFARVHRGDIHLLIADLATPRVRGREFVRLLRAIRPGLRSLFVSSQRYGSLAERRVYESGSRLLHEPFTPEELAHAVRRALDSSGTTPPPHITGGERDRA